MVDADPITSFLDAYHDSGQVPSIPERRPAITCCCGDAACAYLRHNEQALSVLERDVRTAAQIGKVSRLRNRHSQTLVRLGGRCTRATGFHETVFACMQDCTRRVMTGGGNRNARAGKESRKDGVVANILAAGVVDAA